LQAAIKTLEALKDWIDARDRVIVVAVQALDPIRVQDFERSTSNATIS